MTKLIVGLTEKIPYQFTKIIKLGLEWQYNRQPIRCQGKKTVKLLTWVCWSIIIFHKKKNKIYKYAHVSLMVSIGRSHKHYFDVTWASWRFNENWTVFLTSSSSCHQRKHQSSTLPILYNLCGEFTGDRWTPSNGAVNTKALLCHDVIRGRESSIGGILRG